MSVNSIFFCDSCKCTKMHKVQFSESTIKSATPLELIYCDV